MNTMKAPKSIAARGAKRDRNSTSHNTLGIPTMIHVRTPTHVIFRPVTSMSF